jgi:hypothetical protein
MTSSPDPAKMTSRRKGFRQCDGGADCSPRASFLAIPQNQILAAPGDPVLPYPRGCALAHDLTSGRTIRPVVLGFRLLLGDAEIAEGRR